MAQTKIKRVSATTQFEDEEQKKKALDTAIGQITKNFGQGSIIRLGENPSINVSAISVSYTHLDVYKRQFLFRTTEEEYRRRYIIKPEFRRRRWYLQSFMQGENSEEKDIKYPEVCTV